MRIQTFLVINPMGLTVLNLKLSLTWACLTMEDTAGGCGGGVEATLGGVSPPGFITAMLHTIVFRRIKWNKYQELFL